MGAHPYYYLVGHDPDIDAALQALRLREFKAGRYNPVVRSPRFPIDASSPSPGARHRSIDEAREAAQEDGTRSILDIERIASTPDYFAAAPLPAQELTRLFGTQHPLREELEGKMDELLENIPRGQAIYVIVYKDSRPDEIFFAGYSFD